MRRVISPLYPPLPQCFRVRSPSRDCVVCICPLDPSRCHVVCVNGPLGQGAPQGAGGLLGKPRGALGRALILAMLTLLVCDVVGGFIAVASGVDTWDHAWGFDTEYTVPLPVGVVQLALAWLAGREVRPPVGRIAAVLLSAFCLISLLFGSFDGDLRGNIASAGWLSWGVGWGLVLLFVTGVVGVLAAAQARRLRQHH